MLLGVQKSVREWTLTLLREFPFWELESWLIPKSSESNYKGQNSLDWDVPYIIRKLLELRCLKWACMTHLNIWNTSYGQKKGRESNWQFDSWPLKVGNRSNSLACRWHATYRWKALDESYNFLSNLISIGVCRESYGPPKLQKSQVWEFWDSHLGVPGQNAIWMWPSWRGTKYTIRGKVVASPKFEPWWVLWIRVVCGLS
jgi:hypothetical protein